MMEKPNVFWKRKHLAFVIPFGYITEILIFSIVKHILE